MRLPAKKPQVPATTFFRDALPASEQWKIVCKNDFLPLIPQAKLYINAKQ